MSESLPDSPRLREIRTEISALVAEYMSLVSPELITMEWVLVANSTKIEWVHGEQQVLTISNDVGYTSRVGLLYSALSDMT